MNLRQRQELINKTITVAEILFIGSMALCVANVITTDIGTHIFLCLIAVCIIIGVVFGDTFFGSFWDKHSPQSTKEEYFHEYIHELKDGYGMSKKEVIQHLEETYGFTEGEATILLKDMW